MELLMTRSHVNNKGGAGTTYQATAYIAQLVSIVAAGAGHAALAHIRIDSVELALEVIRNFGLPSTRAHEGRVSLAGLQATALSGNVLIVVERIRRTFFDVSALGQALRVEVVDDVLFFLAISVHF